MIIDKPISELLDREPAMGEVGKAFQQLYWVLMRDVNLGTQVIEWITSKPHADAWESVVLALYRHVVELTDAGSVLVRERISNPCKLIARAQFETWQSLKYLLQENREQRSLAYSFCTHLESLRIIAEQVKTGKVRAALMPRALAEQTRLQGILGQPRYDGVKQEHDRMTGGKATRVLKWYSLFDGPANLRALSAITGDEEYYVHLYKYWSGHLHAERTLSAYSKNGDGSLSIEGFRNGLDAPSVTTCMHTFAVGASHIVVDAVVPHKLPDFLDWYRRQGSTKLGWMTSLEFVPPALE